MSSLCDTLPGDVVTCFIEAKLEERAAINANALLSKRAASPETDGLPTVKLGPGLLQMGDDIVAIQAGHLSFQAPNRFWITCHRKRYVPVAGDLVIGIVSAKLSELYRVDIGCHMNAALPLTGFEGATKKNKPNLEVGSVVFARVLVASKDLEPELVCFDTDGKAEGFGEVKPGGLLVKCSCTLSQSLQRSSSPILEAVAKHLSFEIIAGANGRYIINGNSTRETIAIASAIMQSEYSDPSDHRVIIKDIMTGLDSK